MPLDPNIILGVKPPDPSGAALQLAQLRQAQLQNQALQSGIPQEQALRQQQIQGANLENQQKSFELQGIQALNDALQRNVTQGLDGNPQIDHAGVMRDLTAAGHGDKAIAYGASVADLQQKQANLLKANLENNATQAEQISQRLLGIQGLPEAERPQAYQAALPDIARIRGPQGMAGISQTYDPDAVNQYITSGINTKDQLEHLDRVASRAQEASQNAPITADKWRTLAATSVGEADSPTKLQGTLQVLKTLGAPDAVLLPYNQQWTPQLQAQARQDAMTESERETQAGEAAGRAETTRHNVAQEQTSQGQLGVEQQKTNIAGAELGLRSQEFQMKYGPGTIQGYVDSMKQNPDTFQEVPPDLHSAVQSAWAKQTGGLPIPAKPSQETVNTEFSANRTLDTIRQIRTLMQDPDVKNSIGPIAGRLGNLQQDIGAQWFTDGPQARKEQQLRASLQYLLFGEGRTLLGGRPPETLIKNLEDVSASPQKSISLLNGSLDATEAAANNVLDRGLQQRFGAAAPFAKKLGIGGGASSRSTQPPGDGLSVTAPNGTTYRFTSPAQVQAYKRLVGIQ